MKLRINGNSIRLRLLRSEVTDFIKTGRIEGRVDFAPDGEAFFVYRLEHEQNQACVEVRYEPSEVTVVLPTQQAVSWAETDQVSISSAVDLGRQGSLEVLVEKDFACLDLSDADNYDTFPNPQIGAVC